MNFTKLLKSKAFLVILSFIMIVLLASVTTVKAQIDTMVLPVTLIDANVKKVSESKVLVSWSTSEEFNNSHFEIQSSLDGRDWIIEKQIQAFSVPNQIKEYDEIISVPKGNTYLRLVQFDHDSTMHLLEIFAINSKGHKYNVFDRSGNFIGSYWSYEETPIGIGKLIVSEDGKTFIKVQR